MYIKKILVAVALLGLLVAAYFAYYVYSAMFVPNTSFNNNEAYVYVPSNADYDEVREMLIPLVKDIETFDALAKRKKYTTNIRAGRFAIKKDMTNNDIINSIRSNNIPVKVSFNNQNSLELLAGRIATQIEADSVSLLTSFRDVAFQEQNGFNEATALGMYVPNSYEFFWNSSAERRPISASRSASTGAPGSSAESSRSVRCSSSEGDSLDLRSFTMPVSQLRFSKRRRNSRRARANRDRIASVDPPRRS